MGDKRDANQFKLGVCLSGGGSRAVAYHLGCLRALHKYGLLDRIKIISSVSGGSIIAAMYAYSDCDFEEFEFKVKDFLNRGLVKDSIKKLIFELHFIPILLNFSVSFLSLIVVKFLGFFRIKISPIERPFNRTWVMEKILNDLWFKGLKIGDSTKNDITISINSCDLNSKSAVRFGNREISCWHYGKNFSGDLNLSTAVMASAAYPALLPVLNLNFPFTKDGNTMKRKVSLTDGGIYENLGLSPLLPGRDPQIGFNADSVDFILAFDAENTSEIRHVTGLMSSRLISCFECVMKRVRSLNFNLLHEHHKSGSIKGFILSRFSQNISEITGTSNSNIQEIIKYPTDFFPVKENDARKIIERGELVTSALLEKYFLSSLNKDKNHSLSRD